MHSDPNHTSAWNGLISGCKKWIFYPPNQVPPGVIPSSDHSEVATPISVSEWFVNHYSEHSKNIREYEERKANTHSASQTGNSNNHSEQQLSLTPITNGYSDCGPIEGTCNAGELIFIPCHWWHTALNLESSIAATQNYVNNQNLLLALDFLKSEQNYELLEAFTNQINAEKPKLIQNLLQKRNEIMQEKNKLKECEIAKKKTNKIWHEIAKKPATTSNLTTSDNSVSKGFCFNFLDNSNNDENAESNE